ncbi:MAG TPA: hypothetical protein DCE41_11495 [Cytophagales bacterium]|nr:hypothetical protein [Cytophagales bacterium]HAA22316.1 hypothetical protein [Cytophagales bacterium]HAP60470.1 hypothetical protein [Cytophagales bacterium]
MLRANLQVAIRNLNKYRVHTLINVLGLAMGIAGSIVLGLYVHYHHQFDTYWEGSESAFQLYTHIEREGEARDMVAIPTGLYYDLRDHYPGCEAITVLYREEEGTLGYQHKGTNKSYLVESGMVAIDTSFDQLFPLEYVAGSFEAFQELPNGILLSEPVATALYGSPKAALGKTIWVNQESKTQVAAVFQKPPASVSHSFEVLYSSTLFQNIPYDWVQLRDRFVGMIRLREGEEISGLQIWLDHWKEKLADEIPANYRMMAIPFEEMHFKVGLRGLSTVPVTPWLLNMLGSVAVVLVLLACFNFINLSTALAGERAREVGVRKVLGSTRIQLAVQFLLETACIAGIALLVALFLAEVTLISLEEFMGVSIRISMLATQEIIGLIMVCFAAVTLMAGAYPAWTMTRFTPIKVLQNRTFLLHQGKVHLRRTLVVLQFSTSQVLLMTTLVMIAQVYFLKNRDTGYATESRLQLVLPDVDSNKSKYLRDEVSALAGVRDASLSTQSAAASGSSSIYIWVNNAVRRVNYLMWDEHYQELFDIDLLAGTPLSAKDSISKVLVNESFVTQHGFETPQAALGYRFKIPSLQDSLTMEVRGVVEDFQVNSSHTQIPPSFMFYYQDGFYALSVHLNDSDHETTLTQLEKVWQSIYPGFLFDFTWTEDALDAFYEKETQLSLLFLYFSSLAILIGCLGLYGLAHFMVSRKMKEVGVRKVLGANVFNILWLFSKEYIRLIIIGFLLAVPVGVYLVDEWLANFAYRITLHGGYFAAGLLIALLVALLAVGYQSVHAAQTNPIKSLRNE